jgi:hypothetical protein
MGKIFQLNVPSRFDAVGLLARESSRILDLYRVTNFWQYHGKKVIHVSDYSRAQADHNLLIAQ